MKVSIITVCLNSAVTIRRALDSARSQTYRPIEVIIVDGASSDETLKIISEFNDIVSVVISENDKGIYDAMNKGVAKASGNIVYFLNSDDALIGTEIIADAVNQFRADSDLELLYGDVVVRYEDRDCYRTHQHVNRSNITHTGICHQALFAQRVLFTKIGGFNQNFRIFADFDWIIRAFKANCKSMHFPKLVSIFYAGGVSMHDQSYNLMERYLVQHQYEAGFSYWVKHYRQRIRYYLQRWLNKIGL
jgi:glycosyltransferase involved in cell wall biosynthesis